MGDAEGSAELTCPNCGVSVKQSDITCPQCGTNMRTGESYETHMKRARSDELHPEHFAGRLGFVVTILFVLIIMAGFLYQRRVEKVLRDQDMVFADFLRRSDAIDTLIASGKTAEARALGRELIGDLKRADESIIIEDAPTTAQRDDRNLRNKSERKAEKAQLKNLIAKVEYRLEKLR